MLQIIEVEQKCITNSIRQAYSVAAADKFLKGDEKEKFMQKLGDIAEDARVLVDSVLLYGPLTNPNEVVNMSRMRGGVVIVPRGWYLESTQTQVYYAAWLIN